MSIIGNNIVPYPKVLEAKTFWLSFHYKFIANERIEGTLLISMAGSFDPFDYNVLKCGENVFRELLFEQIYRYYPDDDDADKEDI